VETGGCRAHQADGARVARNVTQQMLRFARVPKSLYSVSGRAACQLEIELERV